METTENAPSLSQNPPSLAQKNPTGELYIYQLVFSDQKLVCLLVCVISKLVLTTYFENNTSLSFPTVFSKIEKKAVILDSQFSSKVTQEEVIQFASDCNDNKENLRKQLGVIRTCQFLRTN